jgi:hypothetical protein
VFTNDDPLNSEDPLGLICLSLTCIHNDLVVNFDAAVSAAAIVGTTVGTFAIDDEGQGIEADGAIERWFNDEADTESNSENASCGGQSFTPTTDVQLANGAEIPIDQIKVGEKVLATNIRTGKVESEPVLHVWVNDDHDLLNVVVKTSAGVSTIHTTRHHLIWDLTTREWTQAGQLGDENQLQTSNGSVASVMYENVVPGSAEMWDLTIGDAHDFYALLSGSQSAVLVHNCPNRENFEKMPQGDNTAANRFVESVVKQFGLTEDQAESLHDIISGEDLSKADIRQIARDIKYGGHY